jgi:CBS domain-containing protein
MESTFATGTGSMLAPSFEHARAHDVMRHGLISCDPEESLRTVARIMASYHVHAVVVEMGGDIWGIISARDLLSAAGTPRERLSAGELASTDYVSADAEQPLADLAKLMRDHDAAHVIVTGPGGKPAGVVSTLDIAGCLAWGEA